MIVWIACVASSVIALLDRLITCIDTQCSHLAKSVKKHLDGLVAGGFVIGVLLSLSIFGSLFAMQVTSYRFLLVG